VNSYNIHCMIQTDRIQFSRLLVTVMKLCVSVLVVYLAALRWLNKIIYDIFEIGSVFAFMGGASHL
jgi:hypothetical protein